MALPPEIDFQRDKSASPDRMNRAMTAIDARLRTLELARKALDDVLAQLQQIGLQRLTDALAPIYDELKSIVSFGVVFSASSASPVTIGLGAASFILPAALKDNFAFTGWTLAVSQADTANTLLGRFTGYDRAAGVLSLDVRIASGSGMHADWLLMPCAPPLVPVAAIDAGSDASPLLQINPWPA